MKINAFIGFDGVSPDDESVAEVKHYIDQGIIRAIILFSHNIQSPLQLTELVNFLRQNAPNLAIAVDQEGGRVQRLKAQNGFVDFPSAAQIAQYSLEDAKKIYSNMALQLKKYGINVNFAPVVDLNNPLSPCPVIGGFNRSYGNVDNVTNYAKIFIEVHHNHGILTSIKHFPGHGYAQNDTHVGFADITNSFRNEELEPYKLLFQDHYSGMVMTSHVFNSKFDSQYVASLSYNISCQLLRKELGFKGVIVTDDIMMSAINNQGNLKKIIKLALKATADMLIISFNPKAMQGHKKYDHNDYTLSNLVTTYQSLYKDVGLRKAIINGNDNLDKLIRAINEQYLQ